MIICMDTIVEQEDWTGRRTGSGGAPSSTTTTTLLLLLSMTDESRWAGRCSRCSCDRCKIRPRTGRSGPVPGRAPAGDWPDGRRPPFCRMQRRYRYRQGAGRQRTQMTSRQSPSFLLFLPLTSPPLSLPLSLLFIPPSGLSLSPSIPLPIIIQPTLPRLLSPVR